MPSTILKYPTVLHGRFIGVINTIISPDYIIVNDYFIKINFLKKERFGSFLYKKKEEQP